MAKRHSARRLLERRTVNEARRALTIVNQRGLHARASAKFVTAVAELPEGTSVRVAKGGNEAAGGSILGLMMLGAAKGDTIEVIVAGDGHDAVLDRLCAMVEDGFGES
jgi:phosphocarrier protein